MLPHFFRHYDPWVDRYFIYDNGSTDSSLEILESHPRVTVRHFDVSGGSFVDVERQLSDKIWRESRGAANWVVMIDIDEFIFCPNVKSYLQTCTDEGVTALQGLGYEMVSETFPIGPTPLVETTTVGGRSRVHDKLVLFNPDAIVDTNYEPGRHEASPTGRVVWPSRSEMLLLHYKQLGTDYVIHRSAELRQGLGPGDIEQGWGVHYLWDASEITRRWNIMHALARPVPGLGKLRHMDPSNYDEERLIKESGLFDGPWYLTTYPDIALDGQDPLEHFFTIGWKEERKPNFYFDPTWYLAHESDAAESGGNPLIHYILSGERDGAKPSAWFDPAWYRSKYELDASDSPLRHYLANRSSGKFSPSPEFDSGRPHPKQVEPEDQREWQVSGSAGEFVPPTYLEVVSVLGMDPKAMEGSMSLEPTVVLDVLQLFLDRVEVDEEGYRRAYPDVAEALAEGAFSSARQHYLEHGYFEGRSPRPDESIDSD